MERPTTWFGVTPGQLGLYMGTSTAGFTLFLTGAASHPAALFAPCVFVGLGNGLTMSGATAGAVSDQPSLSGSAGGLAGAMTVAGGAAIAALTGLIVTVENSVFALLGIMLTSSILALLTSLHVLWRDLPSKHR